MGMIQRAKLMMQEIRVSCRWISEQGRPGFLNLGIIDIVNLIILCWGAGGAVLCIVGCLASFLALTL